MIQNPLISIVMPFKNTAAFLPECITSIMDQTFTDWELLAVNDHSTDNSLDLLTQFAENDSRIKVYTNKGNGIIPALQLAYQKSSGQLITRMDSDDVMAKHKLETMKNSLVQSGEGNIALGLVKYFSEEEIGDGYNKYQNWLNRLTLKGINFTEIYKECVIASPCWMVYRTDFDKCGGFNSTIYPEDYDLVFRFHQFKLNCLPSKELLHLWRDYPTRTSRTHEHYAYNSFLEIKIHYFLKLHYNSDRTLVLWGAGKKGKIVAELLLKNNIPFQWICDNPKKIGKTIYNQKLLPFTALDKIKNSQSVVTVANPAAQKEIKIYFEERDLKSMADYFFFC